MLSKLSNSLLENQSADFRQLIEQSDTFTAPKEAEEMKRAPEQPFKGRDGLCYLNALRISRTKKLSLCIGVGMVGGVMEWHAWNLDKSGLVIDSTWADQPDARYFGIVVPARGQDDSSLQDLTGSLFFKS